MFLNCLGFNRSNHTTDTSSSHRQYPTVIQELCHQFSLADLRKFTNNFDCRQKIGSRVYKGSLEHNGVTDCPIALKRIGKSHQEMFEFKNEIELLCQLHHPNFVSLIGFCDDEKEKFLVYEYMSNGSLHRHLHCGKLSWKTRLKICIGAARGLHYLHAGAKRTIIHRDIRTKNILLDDNMHPKLADFGLCLKGARFMSKPKSIQVDRIIGTCGYMAMEYAMHGIVTDKCDVFSFGVVLLEVVCGGKYVNTEAETEFLGQPLEEKIDPNIKGNIAPECWQVFLDITQRCMNPVPDERPAMGEVEVELEHALSLQEQADITNTNNEYNLLSKTTFNQNMMQELERALSMHPEDIRDWFPFLYGEKAQN
ncbi:receptor-like protein kinase ANXUR2 [Cajanus cajan]|uniref:receptor-like protein kinase ANXUR2 n=1 Tax=Cajanus cajan TaxID=3821 RepID=UPI00098D9B43|nr:receptor-like protein kinase ANXUR2 [Cajanus cajan]